MDDNMTTEDHNQAQTADVGTLRLHGIGVAIGAPITLVAVIALWLFLGAHSLKNPNDWIISIARFIAAPFAFFTIIGAPICFIAALIQIITGKRIGMVEMFYQKEDGKKETTSPNIGGTNSNKQ
jgi:hypothetical protein